MWSALRSDLKELASTLAEDTNQVLTTIDAKLTDDGRTKSAGCGDGEDKGASGAGDVIIGEDGDIIYGGGGFEATGLVASAADEAARRRGLEETYLDPLLPGSEINGQALLPANIEPEAKPAALESEAGGAVDATDHDGDENNKIEGMDDFSFSPPGSSQDEDPKVINGEEMEDEAEVRAFLDAFDLASNTDDIAATLEAHPDTVRAHFETLVPTHVTYEQFWQRYYYRCDETRIAAEWKAEQERSRLAREEAISGGINTVKNLFGGALTALGNTVAPPPAAPSSSGSAAYEKFQAEFQEQRRVETEAATGGGGRGLASALFGKGGRPPFVLNTAVSDVDNSVEEGQYGDDEEEELGWSDEEDEEVDGLGGKSDDDIEEQIDFAYADKEAIERLKSQLSVAQEERDQLKETIELQKEEFEKSLAASHGSNTSQEVEQLKLQLFEKNSEIAAMRSSATNDSIYMSANEDDDRVDRKDYEEVQRELADVRKELSRLEEELIKANSISGESSSDGASESATEQKEILSLTEKVKEAHDAFEEAHVESKSLKLELAKAKTAIDQLEGALASSSASTSETQAEIQTLKMNLTKSETKLASVTEAAMESQEAGEHKLKNLKQKLESSIKEKQDAQMRAEGLEKEIQNLKEEMQINIEQLEAEIAPAAESSEHRDEIAQLRKTLEESENKFVSLTELAAEDKKRADLKVDAMTSQLDSMRAAKKESESCTLELREELQHTREAMKRQEGAFSRRLEDEIAAVRAEHEVMSMSSGEKIERSVEGEKLESIPDQALNEDVNGGQQLGNEDDQDDEDDDDGWGESWGSEDDI